MHAAGDLTNLSLSTPSDDNIPKRFQNEKYISSRYLKVFGCRAYVHIPENMRLKLNDKAKKCIFLGYGHEEFKYKL